MTTFERIKLYAEDLWCGIKSCKWSSIMHALCIVGGFIAGFALYKSDAVCWWSLNRYEFACKLVYGGFFAVFLLQLLASVLFALALMLSCFRCVSVLRFVALFVVGLYWGAIVAAIAQISVVLCILYFLLCAAVQIFAFFLAACDLACHNEARAVTFGDAYCACKPTLCLLACELIIKIIVLFLILRPITTSI